MRLGKITQGMTEGVQKRGEKDRALGHSDSEKQGGEEEPAKGRTAREVSGKLRVLSWKPGEESSQTGQNG